MNKRIILNLTLILLLLIGCNSTAQDEPQAAPTEVVTETQAVMDDTTAQDDPQTTQQDVAARDTSRKRRHHYPGRHASVPARGRCRDTGRNGRSDRR